MARQYNFGEILKIEGLDLVESHNESWIDAVRRHAAIISRQRGCVSAVELRLWADAVGWHPEHPNAWGAVFRGKEWTPVGYRKTEHAQGHAREIKVWRHVSTVTRP